WVAGILRLHHAARLYALLRAIGTSGIILPLEVAIVLRIGVNNAAHGSMFGRHLGLDTSPATAIARNHDRTLYRDSQPFKLFVVVAHAVVDVNQRAGDVSVDGICVVGGQLLRRL